jgi:hypothetical protein
MGSLPASEGWSRAAWQLGGAGRSRGRCASRVRWPGGLDGREMDENGAGRRAAGWRLARRRGGTGRQQEVTGRGRAGGGVLGALAAGWPVVGAGKMERRVFSFCGGTGNWGCGEIGRGRKIELKSGKKNSDVGQTNRRLGDGSDGYF